MGWMNILRSSGEAKWTDPLDETVINGAPYAANQLTPSSAGRSAAVVGADTEIPDEIKRRQTALMVSYVIASRAR